MTTQQIDNLFSMFSPKDIQRLKTDCIPVLETFTDTNYKLLLNYMLQHSPVDRKPILKFFVLCKKFELLDLFVNTPDIDVLNFKQLDWKLLQFVVNTKYFEGYSFTHFMSHYNKILGNLTHVKRKLTTLQMRIKVSPIL